MISDPPYGLSLNEPAFDPGRRAADAKLVELAPIMFDLLQQCFFNASMPTGLLNDVADVVRRASGEEPAED